MDDLSICKRIAEIEGVHVSSMASYKRYHKVRDVLVDDKFEEYNPLTDDALCFQLMVKYDVIPTSIITCNGKEYLINNKLILGNSVPNPNKAICLAIIEANKESDSE